MTRCSFTPGAHGSLGPRAPVMDGSPCILPAPSSLCKATLPLFVSKAQGHSLGEEWKIDLCTFSESDLISHLYSQG